MRNCDAHHRCRPRLRFLVHTDGFCCNFVYVRHCATILLNFFLTVVEDHVVIMQFLHVLSPSFEQLAANAAGWSGDKRLPQMRWTRVDGEQHSGSHLSSGLVNLSQRIAHSGYQYPSNRRQQTPSVSSELSFGIFYPRWLENVIDCDWLCCSVSYGNQNSTWCCCTRTVWPVFHFVNLEMKELTRNLTWPLPPWLVLPLYERWLTYVFLPRSTNDRFFERSVQVQTCPWNQHFLGRLWLKRFGESPVRAFLYVACTMDTKILKTVRARRGLN
jgi:hypothetical protein